MPRQIKFLDTTLRDGEQAPGVFFRVEDKVAIATALAKAGIDIIEVGFPVASPSTFNATAKIAAQVRGPVICALCRCTRGDIDKAWSAISSNPGPRLHLFNATSDIHVNKKFENKGRDLQERRAWVLASSVESVRYAKSLCLDVEFTPEDSTRTDLDFLVEVCEAVIAAGATTINLADTVGKCIPEEMARIVREVRSHVRNIDQAEISVHCHNDLGLATANTLAAIAAGADQVEVAVNGIGERAGNCSLEQVVAALLSHRDYYDATFDFKPRNIGRISSLVSTLGRAEVARNAPVIGPNAFAHEAGIHQDGTLKDRQTYEFLDPAIFGVQPQNTLVLGKQSGKHGVEEYLKRRGCSLTAADLDRVYKEFIDLADQKGEVSDGELLAIVANTYRTIPDKYVHRGYHAFIDDNGGVGHSATYTLLVDGVEHTATGGGIGIVEAIFNAIQEAAGVKVNLVAYELDAKSQSSKALADCMIIIQSSSEKQAVGRASATDVTKASALAFIDALNCLAASEA